MKRDFLQKLLVFGGFGFVVSCFGLGVFFCCFFFCFFFFFLNLHSGKLSFAEHRKARHS